MNFLVLLLCEKVVKCRRYESIFWYYVKCFDHSIVFLLTFYDTDMADDGSHISTRGGGAHW